MVLQKIALCVFFLLFFLYSCNSQAGPPAEAGKGSGLLGWFHGDGRKAGGHTEQHKHISGINISHLFTHYWSKQVTWPRPESRDGEILSAHSELVHSDKDRGKNWHYYSVYTDTHSVSIGLSGSQGVCMFHCIYILPDRSPERLHCPSATHKGRYFPKSHQCSEVATSYFCQLDG